MATELHELQRMVRDFSGEMRDKLAHKASRHGGGWVGGREPRYRRPVVDGLMTHLGRALEGDDSQWVDVANYCAFLWKQSHEDGSDAHGKGT